MSSHFRPVDQPIQRHDLVFVSEDGWRTLLEKRADLAGVR